MIAVGCDHGGYELSAKIIKFLEEKGKKFKNFCPKNGEAVDYPDIARAVANSVAAGECQSGILVCGTGIGMSIAANKVRGIRAAVCTELFSAKYTRLHNDTNILCLGGRVTGDAYALEIVDTFISTPFEGGRHQKRVDMIMAIEEK